MKQYKSAIAVLYYNKLRHTKECIESILYSGYKQKDVFCFDNGSKVNVFNDIKTIYPKLNHRREENNKGYSGGFNRSLRWVFASGYESVLFLTNDTRVFPDTLPEIIKTAIETDAGIMAPSIYYLSKPDNIDSIGGFFDPNKGTLHHYKSLNDQKILNKKWDYIPGTALWIKGSVFMSLGGVDETYHTYWEDVDFSFRARKKKIILAKSKKGKILHGVGKTCHKKPEYTTFYFQRNRVRFCKKHLTGKVLNRCLMEIKKDLEEIKQRLEIKNDIKRLKYIDNVLDEL